MQTQTNGRGKSESGASLIEYALIAALVALIAVPSLLAVGTSTSSSISDACAEGLNGGIDCMALAREGGVPPVPPPPPGPS